MFWFLALPRLLSSRVLTRVLSFDVWGDLRCGDGSFVVFALVGRYDRHALYRGSVEGIREGLAWAGLDYDYGACLENWNFYCFWIAGVLCERLNQCTMG